MNASPAQTVKFTAVVTLRFNTNSPDKTYFACYADVIDKGNTDMQPGDKVILRGHSDMYIEKNLKIIVSGEFTGINTYNIPRREYKIYELWPDKDRRSLIAYFCSKRFAGIGKVKATAIVNTLGMHCLDIIRKNPSSLDDVKSLTPEMKNDIIKHIDGTDIDIEIRRIYPSVSQKFLNYMNEAHPIDGLTIIKTDPYILLNEADKCPAIKFELVDAIGRSLNIALTSVHRIRFCVREVVRELAESGKPGLTIGGSVFINISDQNVWNYFYQEVSKRLNIDWKYIDDAIKSGEAGIDFVYNQVHNAPNIVRCYLHERLKAEEYAGNILRNAAMTKSAILNAGMSEIINAINEYNTTYFAGTLSQEQIMAICSAMKNRVSVLTGIPGSGKSSVVEGIIYVWMKLSRPDIIGNTSNLGSVMLAAPTGKAVRRLKDAVKNVKPDTNGSYQYKTDSTQDTGDYWESTNWECRTIASYIYRTKGSATEILEAEQKKRNYGQNRLVIVDETSMVGIENLAELLKLVPKAHFVFVGDNDQLPAIDSGEVLQNLMETGVIPVSTLSINHRAKTAIALNENRIRIHDGNTELVTDPGVFDITKFDSENQDMLDFVIKTYFDELNKLNDITELSMIAPRNNKGLCCVSHLNLIIRDRLNPISQSATNNKSEYNKTIIAQTGNEIPVLNRKDPIENKMHKLRIGDRIVITKNNIATDIGIKTSDADLSVVNGDMGYITKYIVTNPNTREEESSVIISLDDGRSVAIQEENFRFIELGYATTVHKAQGCEYKSVIFIAQSGMCYGTEFATRNLIYTAITRAKRHCHIIGLESTMKYCINSIRPRRNSMLAFRIAGLL